MVQAQGDDTDTELHEPSSNGERGSLRPPCEVGTTVAVKGSWLYERYGHGVVVGRWGSTVAVDFNGHLGHFTRLKPLALGSIS